MYNRIPHNIYNFRFRDITNSSVVMEWFYENSTLVPQFEYNINGGEFIGIDKSEIVIMDNGDYFRYRYNLLERNEVGPFLNIISIF